MAHLYTPPGSWDQGYSGGTLAVDSQNAYWVNDGNEENGYPGAVMQMPLAGGTALTVLSGFYPSGIALANGRIYFGTWDYQSAFFETVPIGGGAVTTLASGLTYPSRLTIDAQGQNAYWEAYDQGPILKQSLTGGGPQTLAPTPDPAGLAINATTAFWTDLMTAGGGVFAVSLNGGSVATLASGLGTGRNGPWAITADASNVYWAAGGFNDQYIVKQSVNGGGLATLISGQASIQKILLDGNDLYWIPASVASSYFVGRIPIAGGTPVTLATLSQGDPLNDFVVDSQSIYVLTNDDYIYRLTPK